jgi:hypothetical protein
VDNESPSPCTTVKATDVPWAETTLESIAALICRISSGLVVVWLCAVAASMVGYSRQKLLWNDEVLYRWIAVLPTAHDIWSALTSGTSFDPLPAPLVTHWLLLLLGTGPLALRLPAMFGLSAMLLFLFLTLRRHVGQLYGLLALLVPFCTPLVAYGYEGRAYGLLYGCLAVAIYCWDRAADGKTAWNVALGLALAAALGCHFYAVFALPAFYLGEVVRVLRRRRISWKTAGALLAASAAELFYLPIMLAIHRQYSAGYWSGPSLGSVPHMFEGIMRGLAMPLFIFLALAATFATLNLHFTDGFGEEHETGFREITALGLGLLLIPLLGWAAGVVVLKAFVDRYVLHGLLGVFLLVPLLTARVSRSNRLVGLALVAAFLLPASLSVGRGVAGDFKPPAEHRDFALIERALSNVNGDLVVSNFLVFTTLVDYSPTLKARCIYLWDTEKELKYTGQRAVSHGINSWAPLGRFRTEEWNKYPYRDKGFLLLTFKDCESDGTAGWLRAYMKESNRYGEIVKTVGPYVIVAAKPIESGTAP